MNRWYDTDALEYLDRDDVPQATRTRVIRGLDRFHRLTLTYQWLPRLVLREVAEVAQPRVLELGAGHGELSRRIIRHCPTARVTVSDVDEGFVAALADTDLGRDPRVDVRTLDATAIDAEDNTWDVAVFALSVHHLGPDLVALALSEATRVAKKVLFVDAVRNPLLLATVPIFLALGGRPMAHDGIISLRRMYSRRAFRDLAATTGPLEMRTHFVLPGYVVAKITR